MSVNDRIKGRLAMAKQMSEEQLVGAIMGVLDEHMPQADSEFVEITPNNEEDFYTGYAAFIELISRIDKDEWLAYDQELFEAIVGFGVVFGIAEMAEKNWEIAIHTFKSVIKVAEIRGDDFDDTEKVIQNLKTHINYCKNQINLSPSRNTAGCLSVIAFYAIPGAILWFIIKWLFF